MSVAKVVMITGAAGNLGRATAQAFEQAGTVIALVGRSRRALEQIFGGESDQRIFAIADLAEQQQVSAMVKAVIDRYQRIDVLCNLAGGFRMASTVEKTTDNDWDFLYDINVRTLIHMTRAVVPQMIAQGGGKIVNVGAFAAQKGAAQMGAYIAAKSAVIRLTETMAAELREQHINVNCGCRPSLTRLRIALPCRPLIPRAGSRPKTLPTYCCF